MFAIACSYKKGFVKSFALVPGSEGCPAVDIEFSDTDFIEFVDSDHAEAWTEFMGGELYESIFIVVEV